jgi:ribonuclease HI
MNLYTAYTDGSCKPNPGTGGYGVVFVKDDKAIHKISGALENTTNNKMELAGVIAALDFIPEGSGIAIFTDSSYVVNTMTKGWKRNKNIPFWDQIDNLIREKSLKVVWEWVRGHDNDMFNERADVLAQTAAFKLKEKNEDVL